MSGTKVGLKSEICFGILLILKINTECGFVFVRECRGFN